MKKINVLIAAFTLAIAAVTPVASSAADADSKEIEISRTFPSSYTLTIPDSPLELTDSTKIDCGVEAYLEYNEKLTVTVESVNNWVLKDKEHIDNDANIPYKLKVGEKDLTEAGNNIVMSVTDLDNNEQVTTELTFSDFGEAAYAGTYGDTLTFKVATANLTDEEKAARTTTTTTATSTTATTATTTTEAAHAGG